MKLSYRGLAYEVSSEVPETTGSTTIGCYRGLPYQIRHSAIPQPAQSPITLRFRGVSYTR